MGYDRKIKIKADMHKLSLLEQHERNKQNSFRNSLPASFIGNDLNRSGTNGNTMNFSPSRSNNFSSFLPGSSNTNNNNNNNQNTMTNRSGISGFANNFSSSFQ